ncbi:MAG: AI-2E family transporter [Candidatus Moranbacteria bacterium]|nr:AI-2E family transporter [Candidatus Moranbacteria bacterium]
MQLKNYNVYFFFAILIGVSVLTYFVLQPFIVPFLIAAILVHLFAFMYEALLRVTGNSKWSSSAITCFIIALIILIPVVVVSSLVVREVHNIIIHFSQDAGSGERIINNIVGTISAWPIIRLFDIGSVINEGSIITAVKNFSQNALFILQGAYQGVAHMFFVIFVTFFSMFYLFVDGKGFIKKIMQLSPLRNNYENILIDKFNSISRATLKGTSLVAIVQGFMGGILFWATGVSSPVLLGVLMTIASVIPSVGSALIWLPVGIIMILLGNITAGIIILLVGALLISTVDNVIKPKLVGRDTQIHPLFVLFSTLGGIALFGVSGFIVGPIIMSLFIALWEIYSLEFKQQLKDFNK